MLLFCGSQPDSDSLYFFRTAKYKHTFKNMCMYGADNKKFGTNNNGIV